MVERRECAFLVRLPCCNRFDAGCELALELRQSRGDRLGGLDLSQPLLRCGFLPGEHDSPLLPARLVLEAGSVKRRLRAHDVFRRLLNLRQQAINGHNRCRQGRSRSLLGRRGRIEPRTQAGEAIAQLRSMIERGPALVDLALQLTPCLVVLVATLSRPQRSLRVPVLGSESQPLIMGRNHERRDLPALLGLLATHVELSHGGLHLLLQTEQRRVGRLFRPAGRGEDLVGSLDESRDDVGHLRIAAEGAQRLGDRHLPAVVRVAFEARLEDLTCLALPPKQRHHEVALFLRQRAFASRRRHAPVQKLTQLAFDAAGLSHRVPPARRGTRLSLEQRARMRTELLRDPPHLAADFEREHHARGHHAVPSKIGVGLCRRRLRQQGCPNGLRQGRLAEFVRAVQHIHAWLEVELG